MLVHFFGLCRNFSTAQAVEKQTSNPENYQNWGVDEVKRFNSMETEEGCKPSNKSEDDEHRQRRI